MRATAHQPVFLPYLGVFRKALDSDVFIVLNDVQFVKNSFMNRNKILTKQGESWLTVPVKKAPLDTLVYDIEVSYLKEWRRAMQRTLQETYGKASFFAEVMDVLAPVFEEHAYMSDLNVELFGDVLQYFGQPREFVYSSDFQPVKNATERLLVRTEQAGCDTYLAGKNGKEYMSSTNEQGIAIEFQDYECKEYPQFNSKVFVPSLSVVDYMMNMGADTSLL